MVTKFKIFEKLDYDIDPYGEEDWNEYDEIINVFELMMNLDVIPLTRINSKRKFERFLKDKFVGKTAYFIPGENFATFKKDGKEVCIKIEDVECDSGDGYILNIIYLIDEKNKKYILPIRTNSVIKLKNDDE